MPDMAMNPIQNEEIYTLDSSVLNEYPCFSDFLEGYHLGFTGLYRLCIESYRCQTK